MFQVLIRKKKYYVRSVMGFKIKHVWIILHVFIIVWVLGTKIKTEAGEFITMSKKLMGQGSQKRV